MPNMTIRSSRNYAGLIAGRFFRQRSAMSSLIIFGIMVLIAVLDHIPYSVLITQMLTLLLII